MAMQEMQGGPPPAPPTEGPGKGEGGGNPMEVFGQIGQAMKQLAPTMDAAPPEIQEKFGVALKAYDEFMAAFQGGPQAAPEAGPSKQPVEMAGNPDVQPVR